jgi:hypothetical protein
VAGVDRVDGVDIRLGRGLDDVGRGGAAAEGPVVALDFEFEFERDLALRVLARGDDADGELAEIGRDPRDALDRAVADRDVVGQDPDGRRIATVAVEITIVPAAVCNDDPVPR